MRALAVTLLCLASYSAGEGRTGAAVALAVSSAIAVGVGRLT